VEAAKFVVSDAVAVLWESVLRHDSFASFTRRVPEQLVRWEADYGWTRRGYGQVPEKETALGVPLARLLTTPDMWRTFTESYLDALDAAGRADPRRCGKPNCAAISEQIAEVNEKICEARQQWNGRQQAHR
jgi:hypothetical protein